MDSSVFVIDFKVYIITYSMISKLTASQELSPMSASRYLMPTPEQMQALDILVRFAK